MVKREAQISICVIFLIVALEFDNSTKKRIMIIDSCEGRLVTKTVRTRFWTKYKMENPKVLDFLHKLNKNPKGSANGIKIILATGALGYGLLHSFYNVDAGHKSIMFNRFSGIQSTIMREGLHFKIPLIQYPIIYDIRSKPRKLSSPTGTKDLQMVNISLRVLTRPNDLLLPKIYQNLGLDWDERVLPSIVNEILKSVIAKFNASQLITQRQQVSLLIRKALEDRARDFNVILDDVSITEIQFSPQYTAAVESKQIAQQEAQRAAFVVERAIQEKQQKVVQAQGEAEAAKLIGEALSKNPGYLKLRKIETAKQISKTLSQSPNKAFLDASLLMMDIASKRFDDSISSKK